MLPILSRSKTPAWTALPGTLSQRRAQDLAEGKPKAPPPRIADRLPGDLLLRRDPECRKKDAASEVANPVGLAGCEERRGRKDLDPARGILVVAGLGLILWIVIAGAVWLLW